VGTINIDVLFRIFIWLNVKCFKNSCHEISNLLKLMEIFLKHFLRFRVYLLKLSKMQYLKRIFTITELEVVAKGGLLCNIGSVVLRVKGNLNEEKFS